jgi:hypothetical protein
MTIHDVGVEFRPEQKVADREEIGRADPKEDPTDSRARRVRSPRQISSVLGTTRAVFSRDRKSVVIDLFDECELAAQPPKLGVARSNRTRVTI